MATQEAIDRKLEMRVDTLEEAIIHIGTELPYMYNIMYETSCQSRFDAGYWMLGAGALGRPRGRVGEGGEFRMGNAGIPVADSFRYLAKPIQYCKV